MKTNGISIILCCYNSELKLFRTLEHLAKQEVEDNIVWEIIVVDNASDDNTTEVAYAIWKELNVNVPLTVVSELNPGLVNARIRGVQTANYEYLLFCDDDNWLRRDYVQNAIDIMNADSKIGVLGGQSVLVPGNHSPEWWPKYQGNYAVGTQLAQTGCANNRGFLYGAGLVTRKSIALKVFNDSFPLLLIGRKGNQCLSGEDWEYCQRTLLLGYNLFYHEDLFYWHDISADRLTIEKLDALLKSFELAEPINQRYEYVRKNYSKYYCINFFHLIKRVLIYIFAKKKNKNRKLELLRFQSHICGFSFLPDAQMEQILGWINSIKV